MSEQQKYYDAISKAKKRYESSDTREERLAAHALAESVRKEMGEGMQDFGEDMNYVQFSEKYGAKEQPQQVQPPQGSGLGMEEVMGMFNQRSQNRAPVQAPEFQPSVSMEQMQGNLQGYADGYFANQEAMLGQARDEQIAQLEKVYNDAVAQGKMSVREAEAQFEANKAEIQQQHYLDSQQTELSAESRGIANSQQLLGMQASDNSRKNGLINQNMTTRDRRINDIKDRINSIKQNKDLDIANANSRFNYGLAGARGQADMMVGQGMFDLQRGQYMAELGQQQALEQMAVQQGYNLQNMDEQQYNNLMNMMLQQQFAQDNMYLGNELQQENMGIEHGYNMDILDQNMFNDVTKMHLDQGFAQENMAMDYGFRQGLQDDQQSFQAGESALDRAHQFEVIDKQGNWDLTKLAKQHGYSLAEIGARTAGALKEISARASARQKEINDGYVLSRQRELAQFQEGTPEYQIRQHQLQAEQAKAINELVTSTMVEADMLLMSESQQTEPSKPSPVGNIQLFPWSSPKEHYNPGEMKEYNQKLDSYNRYLELAEKYGIGN